MENKSLNWDDEITQESTFTLLPEGDYNFKITDFGRAWFDGSEKVQPCNKAIITLAIEHQGQEVKIIENLLLTSKMEGMLSAFFSSIGQKKKGEPLRMNWNKVIGSTGQAKISTREYNGNTYNTVKRWLTPDEPKTTAGFKPGAF